MLFEKQGWHYFTLVILLGGMIAVLNDEVLAGQFLGIPTTIWLILAIAVPILHQIYVWFCWRTELHYPLISQWFGANGFTYYAIGFAVLFVSRLLTIIGLAMANRGTLTLNPTFSVSLAILFLRPSLYTFYSVRKYFGFQRAFGIDHFDKSYRGMPLVQEGIFRFTDNGMYVFGMLILYPAGFLFFSQAALLAALFNHLYIWVHYYCTELPDMRRIYGEGSTK